MSRRRSLKLLTALAAASLVVAACSGDDDDDAVSGDTTEEESAGTEPAGEVDEGPADAGPSLLLRPPRATSHEWFDEDLREAVLDLWCAVNDDGGAVGFLPGAPRSDVAQALSVMVQVGFFKMTGKRVFRMAPLHHHFEMLGWEQVTVVIRFWIITGLCVAAGLGIFYAEWVAGY